MSPKVQVYPILKQSTTYKVYKYCWKHLRNETVTGREGPKPNMFKFVKNFASFFFGGGRGAVQ